MHKKHGLNDSDKVLVTVALWIASIVVFATALTLPMLPDKVTIFYHPEFTETADYYSKYNNIILILLSLIPALIILITALFKRRNRLQNNFISIMLFSIMLSLLMSSVIVFGIMEQFDANSSVQRLNVHALATIIILFVLSVLVALVPMILHKQAFIDGINVGLGYKWGVMRAAEKYWNVGAYGFLVCAIVCVFVPGVYSYIPLIACAIAYVVFILIMGNKCSRAER